MDTQPYYLKTGADLGNRWICNADTGQPIARLDCDPVGRTILVFPGRGAITLDNIYDLLDEISLVSNKQSSKYEPWVVPKM